MAVVTKFPTANEVETTGWSSPNNAHADDGVYATAAPAKNAQISTLWKTFGFDADIPSGATIDVVKIIYEYKVSTTASVAALPVHAVIAGVELANHEENTEPTTDTVFTVDITADRAWARADLLDANLKVSIHGKRGNSNNAVTFSLDYVKVEVTYTAVSFTITSDAGSYALTGTSAGVLAARKIVADAGAYSYLGSTATLQLTRLISALSGAYTLTGQDAGLLATRKIAADAGPYALTGIAADLKGSFVVLAVGGSYDLTGSDATLTKGFIMTADGGVYTITGQDASLLATRLINAEAGAYALTGTEAGLLAGYVITAEGATYVVTGTDATLTYGAGGGGEKTWHKVTAVIWRHI